jgi:hypothetical protein
MAVAPRKKRFLTRITPPLSFLRRVLAMRGRHVQPNARLGLAAAKVLVDRSFSTSSCRFCRGLWMSRSFKVTMEITTSYRSGKGMNLPVRCSARDLQLKNLVISCRFCSKRVMVTPSSQNATYARWGASNAPVGLMTWRSTSKRVSKISWSG